MKNLTLFTLLAITVFSCATKVSISSLIENAAQYHGQEVFVCGKVVQSLNIILAKGYILEEDGQRLLIISHSSVPVEGKNNCVKGKFSQLLKIGTFEMCGVEENENP
jgi:hypothetical protein